MVDPVIQGGPLPVIRKVIAPRRMVITNPIIPNLFSAISRGPINPTLQRWKTKIRCGRRPGAEGYDSKRWAFGVRFFDSAVREVADPWRPVAWWWWVITRWFRQILAVFFYSWYDVDMVNISHILSGFWVLICLFLCGACSPTTWAPHLEMMRPRWSVIIWVQPQPRWLLYIMYIYIF